MTSATSKRSRVGGAAAVASSTKAAEAVDADNLGVTAKTDGQHGRGMARPAAQVESDRAPPAGGTSAEQGPAGGPEDAGPARRGGASATAVSPKA